MRRIFESRLALMLPALLAAFIFVSSAAPLIAQDDPNDAPLGDVARSLRKKTPPSRQIIDDDNLSNVMRQAESQHSSGSALRFLMGGGDKGFQVTAPDVTCSLAFSANVKALLASSRYSQMDLPPDDVVKLEGPATIEGDSLTVSVFNGTNWHVSEVVVALTTVRKAGDASSLYGFPRLLPAQADNFPESEVQPGDVRPEKKPDVTAIYRMRAAAAPWSTTVFSAPLTEDVAPGDEWHWAIIQAKGYPPESYTANEATGAAPAVAQTSLPVPLEPSVSSAPLPTRNASTSSPQAPQ